MATELSFSAPQAVIADPGGTFLLVADSQNNVVRRVFLGNATMLTVAGQFRRAGYSSSGGLGTSAVLASPAALWPDGAGGFFMGDSSNHVVQRVHANGSLVLVAGNSTAGWSGDGGVASAAMLNSPSALSSDNAGGLYVAEFGSNTIRQVCDASASSATPRAHNLFRFQIFSNGTIVTVAGYSSTPFFSGDGG